MPARPHLDEWISSATDEQRILVNEFTALIEGAGDSGSLYEVLEAIVKHVDPDYIKEVLGWVESAQKGEEPQMGQKGES